MQRGYVKYIGWIARVSTVLLLSLAFICASASAQETTGSIRGSVNDPSGAVVPKATVEVSGPALMRNQTMSTDSVGNYAFLMLPPGAYTVTVTAQGFVPVKRTNIDLALGKILKIDFSLEVGSTSQTVEVVGEAAMVDVSQSTIAANVSSSVMDLLPKGRGFDSLIALAPGARYESKGSGYQVDGASGSENVFMIDGMDQTSVYGGALQTSGNIPFEFIAELQIKSSGMEAQYGGAMGGVINVVSKSGSNEFHGDLGMYLRTDSMQARPRPTLQVDPEDDTKLMYLQNQVDAYRYLSPGFTLGGPILKNRAWFFAGYYPELVKYDRTVTFLADDSTGTFNRSQRRDYFNAKVDVAPLSKVHAYGGYIYSPYRVRGLLPARDGSSDPAIDWANRGNRSPAVSASFGGDYTATPSLIFSVRGGYNYTNYKDYGVPRGVSVYQNNNTMYTDVPLAWKQSYSGYTPGYGQNSLQGLDVQTRFRTSADGTYIVGGHTFKAGWEVNKLHMDASQGSWPDGYLRFYWNSTYTGQTSHLGEKMKGTYGYIREYLYGEAGAGSSSNHSIFLQDSWRIHRRLTLQLGVRTEREYVPSFMSKYDGASVPSTPITFGFAQKLAPRIGAAYDVLGNGKWRLAGSFGFFYDLMKYALPQGSFGGAIYQMWFYPLNNPDPNYYLPLIQRDSNGFAVPQPLKSLTPFEFVDYRIPSNNPSDNRIDPDLKPMRRRTYDFTTDYAITPTVVLSARYTHNSVDRIIEDVGTLTSTGEKYYIANPGFGITVAPGTWAPGFPNTPKAKRNYDALELRADKRFSNSYYLSASYTLSRLFGNWSGLASSDELMSDGTGRQDPSVTRYFDLPWMSYDSHGQLVYGRLATDRPSAFKVYGAYTLKSKLGETNIGPNFMLMSGTPLTTEVNVNATTPVYVNGRGDLGRTPVFSQTDLYVYHEIKVSETKKVKIDLNVSNLLNQSTVTSKNTTVLHESYNQQLSFPNQTDFFKGFDYKKMLAAGYADGSLLANPLFDHANFFQGPRYLRFGFKFIF